MTGAKSLQGEASLDDAVLEPPGLSTAAAAAVTAGCWPAAAAAQSSVGIMSDSPVADEDLTMDDLDREDDEEPPVTSGLGVLGSTDNRGVTGRLRGPDTEASRLRW